MKCRHLFLAVVMGFLGLQSQAQAAVTVFNDKAAFLAATGATSATGPLPNLGLIPRNVRVTVGTVTFSTPSREMFIGDTRGIDWSLLLPGNDIAISESENLDVEFGSSIFAFGFDFHEPSNTSQAPFACSSSVPCVDSTFQVTLFDGAISVGSFSFNAPDDVAAFVGVQSDTAFNRVEIREISGGIDDEYFGQFYTGLAYRLPFVGRYLITNGPGCGPTHKSRFSREAIDYALPEGTPVYATEAGEVIFAGTGTGSTTGFGSYIKIEHDDGSVSYYAHLSRFVVTSGIVTKGQLIAYSGQTGKAKDHPHLHFQILDRNQDALSIRTLPVTVWYSGDPNNPCSPKANTPDGEAIGPPVP